MTSLRLYQPGLGLEEGANVGVGLGPVDGAEVGIGVGFEEGAPFW